MQLSDFNFHLPAELIAQKPLKTRSASRLLVDSEPMIDAKFEQITQFLNPNDLLVFNNTKVLPARLFGHKSSGGKIEIMLERIIDEQHIKAMIKSGKSLQKNSEIIVKEATFSVLEKNEAMYLLNYHGKLPLVNFIDTHGHMPLPPYIKRIDNKEDKQRYQSIFAKYAGAVAAPTASLHFDLALLDKLQQHNIKHCFITLHVGAGTFLPIRSEDLSKHRMHNEYYLIPKQSVDEIKQTKQQGGNIVAVGTTVVRALESAYQTSPLQHSGETDIFITPGFQFRLVDKLITNFHLPKSSLLLLVSAFASKERIDKMYQHAIKARYRFFSYGDAMLLTRQDLR